MLEKTKKLYEAGKLTEAIAQLKQEVKSDPANVGMRSFLFGLLCFNGDYESAEKQLEVISLQSASSGAGAQVYKNVLRAEKNRNRVFHNELQPEYLKSPPHQIKNHLDAVKAFERGETEEVLTFLNGAVQKTAPLQGKINGNPFTRFADCHDLLAPILEVIIHDKYIWLPFEQIKLLQIEQPKTLQDLIWISARFELQDGQVLGGYIPTRYLDSGEHPDDLVKLGRKTDWKSISENLHMGSGQRMFSVDDEEKALLEIQEITFDTIDKE